MKKELIKVWCEWDIGLENKVFESKELATEAAKIALSNSDVEGTFDELLTEGLIGFNNIELS